MQRKIPVTDPFFILLIVALFLPLTDHVLPRELTVANSMVPIFILALLGLGLNIITGFTGLLNLGMGAFMALGAYSFAILTAELYPFQLSFWPAIGLTVVTGLFFGALLGLPTINLKGDYLAIVTLGFGEIVQDSLKNLESITKGSQGINPLPPPSLFGFQFQTERYEPWYYLFLALLVCAVVFTTRLERSRVGRKWLSLREDELAATVMGVSPVPNKLLAFAIAAAFAALAGALWASSLSSTGEPSNYDFQLSIIALCMVIVGGIGSTRGVLLGAVVMVGFNSIFLVKLTQFLAQSGALQSDSVLSSPNNWKYSIFGFALILTMRFRPLGLLGAGGGRR